MTVFSTAFLRHHFLYTGIALSAFAMASTPITGTAYAQSEPASAATKAHNHDVAEEIAQMSEQDWEDARRGLLASITDDAILNDKGEVVWDIKGRDFLTGDAPDTTNPSLWRQSQLLNIHGLFEVQDGIYQVRGYDLSVMSIIRGKSGWIIVDPLTSVETARAALKLANDTLGKRPVSAVIYTHSHGDHFGGVGGVITNEEVKARNIPIVAPKGFSEEAISENLLAGNYMSRRTSLMFGNNLPLGTTGKIGTGLGNGLPNGTISLIAPTDEVDSLADPKRTIDGVEFVFIDANGTEAPAEFMFYLPEFNALCTAEVVTGTLHNALTLRGAKARNLIKWSEVIDEVLQKYGTSNAVFASHHWPKWGAEHVSSFLKGQRDIYRYVHDQTLRLANQGMTMHEIANAIPTPPINMQNFDTRGYYGTINHNAKAVYQYYFGWWDGVPANFDVLPAEERATRMVEAIGGTDATIAKGKAAHEKGDYRWAAELFNAAVFADGKNDEARQWLANSYEQMGYQAESGAWRSYYLTAAQELRSKDESKPLDITNAAFLAGVPTRELFNAMAVRYDPAKFGQDDIQFNFIFPDTNETISLDVGSATAFPRYGVLADNPAASITINRSDFNTMLLNPASVPQLMQEGRLKIEGDPITLYSYFQSLDRPSPDFNVVTP